MNDEAPVGRAVGSKVLPTDLVTVGFITRTITLIVEEQPDDATHVPGDTWVQDVDDSGIVTGQPRLGPPDRMTIYRADEIFVLS